MPFELLTPTAATLKTVTPRTEIHGDEPVSAISLGLSITGPNTLLDALDGGKLRIALYMAVPGQEDLPGVADSQAAEAERQAGDLFADQHAGDFGRADDDSAGPGTGSSDDAPFGEAQTGENWPFPQGDGAEGGQGGETAAGAAEFEAGAKAAIGKAAGGRRGRKTRADIE